MDTPIVFLTSNFNIVPSRPPPHPPQIMACSGFLAPSPFSNHHSGMIDGAVETTQRKSLWAVDGQLGMNIIGTE